MTTPPAATPTPAPASVPVPSNFRAGTGQLRAEVARVLSDRAGSALSVTEIARLLGHSGGAVGNACQTLTDRREATMTGTNPRRYEANSATATAAVRAVITPPRTSSPPPATAIPAQAAARPATATAEGGRPVPITRPASGCAILWLAFAPGPTPLPGTTALILTDPTAAHPAIAKAATTALRTTTPN